MKRRRPAQGCRPGATSMPQCFASAGKECRDGWEINSLSASEGCFFSNATGKAVLDLKWYLL